MKIKFLQDYGGRDTREIHYEVGQIVDEEHGAGSLVNLAARGIVEILPDKVEEKAEFVPARPQPTITRSQKPRKAGQK